MTQEKDNLKWEVGKLILCNPDTELQKVVDEVEKLMCGYPEILERIEANQIADGKKEKLKRIRDKEFEKSRTPMLDGFELNNDQQKQIAVELKEGCPRMHPRSVFLFLALRGFFGSISNREAVERMRDSRTLEALFFRWNVKRMPGITTIIENINVISNKTREYMLDCEIRMALDDDLDDFDKCAIDSTAVEASTSWPTDSGIMLKLLGRIFNVSQKLDLFGMDNFQSWWCEKWLDKLHQLNFRINCTAGKPKSRGKVKKLYRRFLTTAQKMHDHLLCEFERLQCERNSIRLKPSLMLRFDRVWNMLENDIAAVLYVLYYAEARVFCDITLPSTDKILSLSDPAAAYIAKGGRTSVIGYRPQLARSENGFVTALILPEGNASDSGKLVEMVTQVCLRTGVIPPVVSVDDGYSSTDGREKLLGMGISVVSMSGAKGKKITPEDDWESEEYKQARRWRSSVESLMFVLKHSYGFGRMARRGIEEVRAEMLEKIIAYNFCRIVTIREKTADSRLAKKVA